MARQYHLKKIRILLIEGFTAEELRRFCYDTPIFRPVYDELAQSTGKAEIVDHLIEYADQKFLLEKLLALVKVRNPARYEKYQPYYDSIIVPDVQDISDEAILTSNVGGLFDNRGIQIGEISFWGCVIRNVSIAVGVLLVSGLAIILFNDPNIKRLIFPNPTATLTITPTASATRTPVVISSTPTGTFQPTQEPTITSTREPTKTPQPSIEDTPIPASITVTPADTLPPTPTSTDALTVTPPPTLTPTPTGTPMPPPPTPLPADALVVVPNGLELLCGPGNRPDGAKYDLITVIPQGTPLEILRRVIGKDDWIKVGVKRDNIDIANVNCSGRTSIFSESSDVEGWVPLGAIQVNVDLTNISPMYEFGPVPIEPKLFDQHAVEATITFKWQDYGPLAEYQYYSLILVRDDLPDELACFNWQSNVPEMAFKPKDFDCTPGDYHWGVGLVTNLNPQGSEPVWQDDSEFDQRSPLGLGQPHSKTPFNSRP